MTAPKIKKSVRRKHNEKELKLRPITYDGMNHAYYVLGEKVGNAFKDRTALI